MTFNTFLRDITERRQGEEAIGRLATIVESAQDAIFSTSLDGTILTWNFGAERLYQYPAEEAVGRHVSTSMPQHRVAEIDAVGSRSARVAGSRGARPGPGDAFRRAQPPVPGRRRAPAPEPDHRPTGRGGSTPAGCGRGGPRRPAGRPGPGGGAGRPPDHVPPPPRSSRPGPRHQPRPVRHGRPVQIRAASGPPDVAGARDRPHRPYPGGAFLLTLPLRHALPVPHQGAAPAARGVEVAGRAQETSFEVAEILLADQLVGPGLQRRLAQSVEGREEDDGARWDEPEKMPHNQETVTSAGRKVETTTSGESTRACSPTEPVGPGSVVTPKPAAAHQGGDGRTGADLVEQPSPPRVQGPHRS